MGCDYYIIIYLEVTKNGEIDYIEKSRVRRYNSFDYDSDNDDRDQLEEEYYHRIKMHCRDRKRLLYNNGQFHITNTGKMADYISIINSYYTDGFEGVTLINKIYVFEER